MNCEMLKKGIYEDIINHEKQDEIIHTEECGLRCNLDKIDNAELPNMLANYYAKILKNKLEVIEEKEDRIKLVNRALSDIGVEEGLTITNMEALLAEVMSNEDALMLKESKTILSRPLTGFNTSSLFTGGSCKIGLGEEIRREIESADEICFIISFLRNTGVSVMYEDLLKFCNTEGKKLRIITTTYCGVTEEKALLRIAGLPNTEIRISYNKEVERLHAKAYIFKRNSGLNTAYIGSSNLSKTAHTDGLEWNVKVTNRENPHIIKNALATFDIYWNDKNFVPFTKDDISKFREERNKELHKGKDNIVYHKYTLLPFQKQMLDEVRMQREVNGVYRNLVVAATGTGKTVMSAFDFYEFKKKNCNCRILFIAHREEILKQSRTTYRGVLSDFNFGNLWVGSYVPTAKNDFDSLFVSIAMFNSRYEEFFSHLPTDFYDYIVIDEAHHSQADSYRKLLSHFKPKILLGLTATPERMDGKSLLPDFDDCISSEIRLPQALQAGLLTPFLYLCVTDTVDLSGNDLWSAGKYSVTGLDNVLCDEMRADNIRKAVDVYVNDDCKTLCFCITKHHAEFMADQFRKYDLKAESLTSDDSPEIRVSRRQALCKGDINFLFVVDIFNEGVDIPEIDTVMFLRPTESLTVFLQQLGRGLRLSPGKDVLTVLDFVAQANKKYDFTSRFRALTLHPDRDMKKQVNEGFTSLPFGCNIVMEQKARQYILDNIQNAIYNKNRLIKEINAFGSVPTIFDFLRGNGQDIRLIYRKHCWSELLRDAGRVEFGDDDITKLLVKGMHNLIHCNTPSFLHFLKDFAHGSRDYMREDKRTYALMLYYDLYQMKCSKLVVNDIYEALDWLHNSKYELFMKEIGEIADYLLMTNRIKTRLLDSSEFDSLELYGCYSREEIFTLVGRQTEDVQMKGIAAGVFNLPEHNAVLLFVTLNKSEKDFSPSTLYNDYVINENYFHWQSQNTDAHNNNGGKRYLLQQQNGTKIILFVREEKTDGFGLTCPYHCFGYVDYVESSGDRPMNVKWKVSEPVLPQYLNVM